MCVHAWVRIHRCVRACVYVVFSISVGVCLNYHCMPLVGFLCLCECVCLLPVCLNLLLMLLNKNITLTHNKTKITFTNVVPNMGKETEKHQHQYKKLDADNKNNCFLEQQCINSFQVQLRRLDIIDSRFKHLNKTLLPT